ncbi:MAG: indolepyruvate oxidoreductase subunit beta family protein [Rhodobacteraceae bacterium]|nr:indolepyruvate oxidoreductase subunit beta family protein [Paracoccaceae bacterium]
MPDQTILPDAGPVDPAMRGLIKLAVMAVGGQGGGVLTNWITDCAKAEGYAVQATSVAGVAQRTGATVYYVEMAPAGVSAPVFSLMPAAGDVDILLAAELMEAGRAIIRGFVTPDRTTLIASTHRALALTEKIVPGDGIAQPDEVVAAAEIAAQRLVLFDMEEIAQRSGTVISASLLGALAGSGALPFVQSSYEAAIRASGRGVEPSLAAFGEAYARAKTGQNQMPGRQDAPSLAQGDEPRGPDRLRRRWLALVARMADWPEPLRQMAKRGLVAVVDFQGLDYGADYLDRVQAMLDRDSAAQDYCLSIAAAKYIARAMAYDDVIRTAELKTRSGRFHRIRAEMAAEPDAKMMLREFLKPGAAEIAGMMPRRLGGWFAANPARMQALGRIFGKGRRIRTDRLGGFLQLYLIAGLKGWRRYSFRHAEERARLNDWLAEVQRRLPEKYDLGVEILTNQRLIKGYSDTHTRGLDRYGKVMAALRLVEARNDAADWARRLREAALADHTGTALDGAVATIRSFSDPPA